MDLKGFQNPQQAGDALGLLTEIAGEPFADRVVTETLETPDPMRALVGLTRFIERSISPANTAAFILASRHYTKLLVTLLSQSNLLTDILCRNPEYALWLYEEAETERAVTAEELLSEMSGLLANAGNIPAFCARLRRLARREVLRIAARDVFYHAALPSITEDLSNLADASLEIGIQAAAIELGGRYGIPLMNSQDASTEPTPASFVVLAMGKLGGRELNFSSDIDLLFVYSDHGETSGGSSGKIANEAYFAKLGEMLIKIISEPMAEGIVFRVDMRLRPFGKIGPLATPFDQALEYYMNFGRAWERQALIKARPCAGDIDLGNALLKKLRPFVFPRYFDDATLEDIREVKSQTEAKIAAEGKTDREVKLGRGGIRDIEFTVQMLQLLNGGRFPELRTRNSLEAIQALGELQSLTPFEAAALSRHYVFLRQVEHRLQIEGGQQIHALPQDRKELAAFSKRMGYQNADAFMSVYRMHTDDARRLLERFLAAKGAGNLWVAELLDPKSESPIGIEKLREAGFANPVEARNELLILANGPENAPYTRDVAQHFSVITPNLIEAFAALPTPDSALMRLGQILARLRAPGTLYELLRYNPALCKSLATLIANSDYLCSILVRDVSLLDVVGSPSALAEPSTREELEQELAALERAAHPDAAPYRMRDGEMLKIALRDLVQGISVYDVGDELTLLAEVILADALKKALVAAETRYGQNSAPFAILALGKFGGREMGYGSDLDLVFVYEPTNGASAQVSDTEYFAAVASHTLKSIKEPSRYGLLYDIDARLRPDGSKGILAITAQRLVQYYQEEAQPWERFALMKVRAVAGDYEFRKKIEADAREIAFNTHLTTEALDHLESLRAKAAQATTIYDLKRYDGGVSEIEYSTRLLQVRHAAKYPELKRGGVFRALAKVKDEGLAPPTDCDTLASAYEFYRRLINRVRMMNGTSTSRLPEDPEIRNQFGVRLGLPEDIMKIISVHRAKVHDVYKRILEEEYARLRL